MFSSFSSPWKIPHLLGRHPLTPLTRKQRSAATKIDWAKVSSSLGLRGQTATSLQSFKKRNDEARRKVTVLSEQPQTVDFSHYRGILKNKAIVDEIENHFKTFKPASYDVNRQLKAIDAFESQAVQNAEATKGKVEAELQNLQKTLQNIETARPFEDLTVVRISLDVDLRVRLFTYMSAFLGRGCRRPARDRREDRFPRLQGQVDAPWLQGMYTRFRLVSFYFLDAHVMSLFRSASAICPLFKRGHLWPQIRLVIPSSITLRDHDFWSQEDGCSASV